MTLTACEDVKCSHVKHRGYMLWNKSREEKTISGTKECKITKSMMYYMCTIYQIHLSWKVSSTSKWVMYNPYAFSSCLYPVVVHCFAIDKICFYSPNEYESNFDSPFISDVVPTHIQRWVDLSLDVRWTQHCVEHIDQTEPPGPTSEVSASPSPMVCKLTRKITLILID